jgi:hypothetical protein
MGTPQIIVICLMAAEVGLVLAKNGEPRTGKYSFITTLIATGLNVWLLHWGGFFSGGAA